ncbi:MAG: hypothetical protein GX080_07265 [Tissierellia bacterium]|nr:hypothetical protein [Tissierellia bacterium]
MNAMLKKLVDQNFMTEEQADYIEKAIERKESLIVSGHRGWGTRPLIATLMAVAKSNYKSLQVKGFDDLDKTDIDYLLIPGIKDIDFGELVKKAMAIPNISLITIKDPEHPYSIFKLLRDVFKETQDSSKTYHILECAKVDDEPILAKITKAVMDEKGKLIKEDIKREM